ncbi:uncharacterized protein N7500_000177 [Penicillium coprophilum]|uniref:uncharacterized protein n=1 Tax=Penicillium coprophilum TaxID=36646 RepID=UPI00239FB9AE|nr:uncharacterized protein N7500_000177 [Penicillium coprophilum]KAJ5177478.1 hypothetical protein N7500_000177 [Penicillium coprophilum]
MASRRISASKLVLTARPPMKLGFIGLRSSLFLVLLYVRRGGCFTVLKRLYGRMVETKIRNGINYIDKLDFLEAYPLARIEAFKSETIKNSFLATGLVLFGPDRVISKLNIRLRTLTPPPSRGSELSRNFIPKTPATEKELPLLCTRSRSPPSLSDCALDQLVKGFCLTMQGAILLAKENKELRAANEKQIPTEEGLLVQEEVTKAPTPGPSIPRESAIQPRTRPRGFEPLPPS